MGKACLRFRQVEDLALDGIGKVIRRTPVRAFLRRSETIIITRRRFRIERRPGNRRVQRGRNAPMDPPTPRAKDGGRRGLRVEAAASWRGAVTPGRENFVPSGLDLTQISSL